ncbi:hypothetical protein PIB30_086807 [Stylosanthes scabra]|uniref:Uncharacterized protein n=1 Tax=Stylosanthes scabra TaxID=79078 RepID=A0ABU6VRP5_9FABA|nr:hypothetical protein [Stylosanthes scabra]
MRDVLLKRPTGNSRNLLAYPIIISRLASRYQVPEFSGDEFYQVREQDMFCPLMHEHLYRFIFLIQVSPTHRRRNWGLCVLQPDPTPPRQPLIKSRRGQQLCLSMPRRRNPRICVDRHSSAQSKQSPRLDVIQEA